MQNGIPGSAFCSFNSRSCVLEARTACLRERLHDDGGTSLRPVGMDQRIEMASHLGNRRHLENARDPDLEMQDVADAGENVYGRERVAAQREEIIMDTDPFDLEDLGPEFRQHLLEVRLRRDEGLLRDDKVREPQLCRQADALHFARWALWEFLNEVHLARDLEVGEAPDGKLANVCSGSPPCWAAIPRPTRRPRLAWGGARQRLRLLPPPDVPGALRRLPAARISRHRG